ncbi:hypothetical protein KR51_00022990 [Rubidibacter lacunae KORDI 51-2]|uniref:Uncharacterized protein n=1 Tax=Rubidibacter lacunae KORDI 51-2 TaxID=582515 RepID=U5DJE0_9CHRO|nr:hypothetical protein [Rubidibacter lacunae]ERN41042.1 hypothetical protein KR51_00022990 [Rubidibacter lacunae KORDI 51-2]
MKKLALGLMTLATVGLTATPALAGGGDSGTVQTTTQESIVTGDGNTTYQRSEQIQQSVRDRSSGDSAVIQDAYQSCDVYGNSSTCVQEQRQIDRRARTSRKRSRSR